MIVLILRTRFYSQVTFQLSETDTIWHFDVPGVSVSRDSELAEEVTMRNERYEEVWGSCFYLLPSLLQ